MDLDIQATPFFWQNIWRNQVAGMLAFLGSRRCFDWVAPTARQLLLWGIFGCLANTLVAWLIANQQGEFNAQGLVSYVLWPFLALIAGVFVAQKLEYPKIALVPALLWLVLDVNIALFQSLIQFLSIVNLLPAIIYPILPPLILGLFIWQSMAVVWVLSKVLHWPWWERILILLATLVTLVVWQSTSKTQPIWKFDEPTPTISEQAVYAQSTLLNQALDGVQLNAQAQTQWYFLGIAGAGYQNVFKSEIERMKEQFDTRFGTLGHSIALINNQETTDTLPMATKTSIAEALKRIGQRMNRDNDVLFLYMTSHGLENQFELAQEPIDMDDIDPQWLRKALDDANIRWRVIVVSACYSGSFIPALQSPDTLVITASASDKSSFGCSNEADYTYFGRAFIDEAMRNNSSLKAAFDQAQATVQKWETAQGFDPSEPQWSLGQNMQLILPQFEKRLFPQNMATGVTATPSATPTPLLMGQTQPSTNPIINKETTKADTSQNLNGNSSRMQPTSQNTGQTVS
ncbi:MULTISPECIES: C13 family peptidase [unclassified Acinetobacter]|uniref:C13 family peptidase n=1 Tax=unclassified Acinetobacter TaxID=196816 RepID=UPI0035B97A1E